MPGKRRLTATSRIFQLKVGLREVRPPVWRRALVPGEATLADLHAVLQIVMGWTDSHLHEFEVDGHRYGIPDPDWDDEQVLDESRVRLSRVAGPGSRLRYAYDFGDGWNHQVTVEQVLDPEPGVRYPWVTAGRQACPPENVGGPWGYQDFLAALGDPQHPEHGQWAEWIGGTYDPGGFDLAAVNEALAAVAWTGLPGAAGRIRPRGSAKGTVADQRAGHGEQAR